MYTVNTANKYPKKPASQDWHKADIIGGLWKRGTSVQKLSRENGYSGNGLELAIRKPWPRAQRIIAEALGVAAHEIWPSRYLPDGSPKGMGERVIQHTRYAALGNRPNGLARKAG